jgi:chemotaxis protein MotA
MTQKLGWIILLAVGLVPIALFSSNPAMFLSAKAITIVLVGTAGVTMATRSLGEIKAALRFLAESLGRDPVDEAALAAELDAGFTHLHRRPDDLAAVRGATRFPEFRYALALLEKRVDADAIVDLLERRVQADADARETARQCFNAISRFPPALGLLATVLAMINVLENMGGGGMGVAGLGPAMAAGLVATF